LSLLEFQQNSDVTYRLYDYGRPRELHLDDGLAVADLAPYRDPRARHVAADETAVLVDGPKFRFAQVQPDTVAMFGDRRRWVLPVDGAVHANGLEASAGECLLVEAGEAIELLGGRAIVGAEA
jgi:mannose-6-phosphate isomerase